MEDNLKHLLSTNKINTMSTEGDFMVSKEKTWKSLVINQRKPNYFLITFLALIVAALIFATVV